VKCEACEKAEATVLVKTVVDGQKREAHLCAHCAETGLVELKPTPFAAIAESLFNVATHAVSESLLEKIAGRQAQRGAADVRCPSCGMTLAEFHKKGRLGCARDYTVFGDDLAVILSKIHGANQHKGHTPERLQTSVDRSATVDALRHRLDEAVKLELYEEAARLRDQVREAERTDDGRTSG
jgi:protein arginine kinase activator